MKKYLTVFVVTMCLVVLACSTGDKAVETSPAGVTWVEKSFDEVLVMAKEENKPIVIDFFSPG